MIAVTFLKYKTILILKYQYIRKNILKVYFCKLTLLFLYHAKFSFYVYNSCLHFNTVIEAILINFVFCFVIF